MIKCYTNSHYFSLLYVLVVHDVIGRSPEMLFNPFFSRMHNFEVSHLPIPSITVQRVSNHSLWDVIQMTLNTESL